MSLSFWPVDEAETWHLRHTSAPLSIAMERGRGEASSKLPSAIIAAICTPTRGVGCMACARCGVGRFPPTRRKIRLPEGGISMQYHKFGTTDFEVPPMGLGCMSMSGAYGPSDDAEAIATLHRAFDLGINFIDTSASYGNGHNHELIRKALEGRRESIVIHSKTGS